MKLKKSIIIGLFVAQSTLSIIGVKAVYDEITAHKAQAWIVMDNFTLQYNNPIVTIDDTMYVPLRETFENLDYEVNWSNNLVKINSKDLYHTVKDYGYTYHIVNDPLPVNKEKLSSYADHELGIHKLDEDAKYISNFENANDVITGMSGLWAELNYSTMFKNSDVRYFTVYNGEDIWIVNPETSLPELWEFVPCFVIDKATGEVNQYRGYDELNTYVQLWYKE